MDDPLKKYKAKRNFAITPEPADGGEEGGEMRRFVIQKHWASRLHYDFRLELDGTMKSWAVSKGPSYDPHDKRMAVHVEDHPISYNSFEGIIPDKQYGAGKVIIWDKGTWHPLGDPRKGYEAGNLKFEIRGHKMHGKWVLVRMKSTGKQEAWLLIKEKDELARPASEFSVVDEMPDSVKGLAAVETERKAGATKARQKAPKANVEVRSADHAEPHGVSKASRRTTSKKEASRMQTAPLPATFSPQLATLVERPPTKPDEWLFEIKLDGYRMLSRIEGADVKLFTRNGNDWTHKLEALRAELIRLDLPSGWYDGEIVVMDDQGRPNFGLLQNAFDERRSSNIVYYIFDAPYLAGNDIRQVPLFQRRDLLRQAMEGLESDAVRFSASLDAPPKEMVEAACRMGLEGIIGKRRDGAYVSRRSPDWIKLKCSHRQEFVVGGYTDPQGSRSGFGSLLLGVYDDKGALHYAGNVGTGFDDASLREVTAKLKKLAADTSPFAKGKSIDRGAHWVKPELVAEVVFGEWTSAGSIRHSSFQGLRADKKAKFVFREAPARVEDESDAPAKLGRAKARPDGEPVDTSAEVVSAGDVLGKIPPTLKVTNAGRVVDKESGVTKIELIRYCALVAPLMLEHLKGRPLSLVRAPAGVGGELFFQKHADLKRLPGVHAFAQDLDPDHPPMLEVATTEGLLSAAQWNVVEFHTQNAFGKTYDKPNRMIFDLDPGKGIKWQQIQEAARIVRAFLEQLGLPVFLKTSGGKGLHLVVPIKPALGWDEVKAFSQAIVQHIARTIPDRFSAKSGPSNRGGKIYIDYLRNGRGATTACAWSARSRPGLGISVPVSWEELEKLRGGDHWTVRSAQTRLDQGNAPWDGYAKAAVGLSKAMKIMDFS